MHSDNSAIHSCLVFFRLAAREISSPLMTHLCAAQCVIGDISVDSFSRKYSNKRELSIFTVSGSFRRELSSCQIADLVGPVENAVVMEMGLWSERSIGFMVALMRDAKSVYMMKK